MKIYSMSRSKKDEGNQIEEGTAQIIEHLIKLYLYPDNQSVNHWRREIPRFLNRVHTLKKTGKYPKPQFIMDYTWGIHSKYFDRYLDSIIKEYGESTYETNISVMRENIIHYFEWLACILSYKGYATYSEIYKYLQENGF